MSRSRHMKTKRASGGKVYEYAGAGSPTMEEAKSKKDSFKHGGKAKGHKSSHRLDKRAMGGRSPLSSAASTSSPPGRDYAVRNDEHNDAKGGRIHSKKKK